jgi:hypothetical protein
LLVLTWVIVSLPGCAWFGQNKQAARSVVDVARLACEQWAAEMGAEAQTACATEKQLRPFIDSLFAAKRRASAIRLGATLPERVGCEQ